MKNKLFLIQPNKIDESFLDLEKDRFHDEYDRNKDGYLTGDELLFWVSYTAKIWVVPKV